MVQRIEIDSCSPNGAIQPHNQALLDILQALFRHKGKASLVLFGSLVLAAVVTIFAARTYRSEAKLLVRLGRENATLDPTASLASGSMVAGATSRENEINSVAEILQSRQVFEKVVDAVGPDAILHSTGTLLAAENTASRTPSQQAIPPQQGSVMPLRALPETSPHSSLSDRDKAILKLTKLLRVEPVKHSNIVAISYEGYSPETAQAIVTNLIDCYLEEHLRLNRTPGAHEFLAEQTKRLQSSLAHSESELHDLMNETSVVSCDARRRELEGDLSLVENALRKATAAAAASNAQVVALSEAMRRLPKMQVADETSGVGDYGTDVMRGQLYSLQLKEHELSAKYTQEYPELREIREQVAAAEKTLDRENRTRNQVSKHPDQTYKESEISLVHEKAVLASWQAQIATLEKQLGEVHGEMRQFNDMDLRHRALQRDIDLQAAQYRKYSENLDQARIDQALEVQRMSNISIAQPATYEAMPVRPRPLFNLALALVLGGIGAVGTAVAADRRKGRVKTTEGGKRQPHSAGNGKPAVRAANGEKQLCSQTT